MKMPATARMAMNPNSVMPRCVRFIWIPFPIVVRSRDARPHPREIHPAGAHVPVQPDQEGLAAEVFLRQEVHVPEATVLRIITIVAHDEILARRHRPLPLALLGEERVVLAFQDSVRAARQLFL